MPGHPFLKGRCSFLCSAFAACPQTQRLVGAKQTKPSCPPLLPCPRGKISLGFAVSTTRTEFRALTRRANAIQRARWMRIVCRETLLVFPCAACHALPRLPHLSMPPNAFLADPCCVIPLPLPCRVCCSRFLFLALIAWPFFPVSCAQGCPIYGFPTPLSQQQFAS